MKADKTIYEGTYLKLTERVIGDQVFETAHLRGAVIVFPKSNDGKFLFVKEQRPHESHKVRLKPVTGFIDDGDDWLSTAKKELREEASLIAESFELIRHIPVSGSIVTDKYFVIASGLAQDPDPIPNPDGDVIEELVYLDLDQAIAMTISNEMPLVFDSLGLFLLKELKL